MNAQLSPALADLCEVIQPAEVVDLLIDVVLRTKIGHTPTEEQGTQMLVLVKYFRTLEKEP